MKEDRDDPVVQQKWIDELWGEELSAEENIFVEACSAVLDRGGSLLPSRAIKLEQMYKEWTA